MNKKEKRIVKTLITYTALFCICSILNSCCKTSSIKQTTSYSQTNATKWAEKKFIRSAKTIYNKAGLKRFLSYSTFSTAFIGYLNLKQKGLIKKDDYLVIIDYSKPSDEERFFVVDLKKKKLIYKSLVAHGKHSGEIFATEFSNRPGSHKSSLGFFITAESYKGRHGNSLSLIGLEPGINDNAYKRRIVIHGAKYVSKKFIKKYGRLGRSLGCPALPLNIASSVINTIKDGSCVFIYGNDNSYFRRSRILKPFRASDYLAKAQSTYGIN